MNARVSWSRGAEAGNDPWLGNTLEWLTTSPPPVYNFGTLPRIRSERPLRDLRLTQAAAASGDEAVELIDEDDRRCHLARAIEQPIGPNPRLRGGQRDGLAPDPAQCDRHQAG